MDFRKHINCISSSWILPMIFSICARVYYYNVYVYSEYVDTATYLDAGINLLNGHIDMMRTPIFPLFMQACLKLFPQSMNIAFPIIQNAIFIMSIFFFHKICTHFIKNKYIQFFTCLIYACVPSIASWEYCVLTETFSIVSVVIFVYLIVLYLEKKSYKYLVITSLFIFIMVMIKPGFIFIFVIFLGFLILNFILTKLERREMIIGFVSILLSLSLVFAYTQINEIQNHVNGISIVTDINDFSNIVFSGIYKNGSDIEVIEAVDELILNGTHPVRAAYEVELIYRSYDPVNRIGSFNKEVMQKYRKEFLLYTINKFITIYDLPINIKYAAISDKYGDYIPKINLFDLNLNFFCVYFLLIIEIVVIILQWIREKVPPWGNIGIFFIIFMQVVVIIIGAQGEFSRLICPILPLIIIMIFKNIDKLIGVIYK